MPRLVSIVRRRFEDGAWTGEARCDRELRRIFPDLVSLRLSPQSVVAMRWWRLLSPDTIIITGNELSEWVPRGLRTIVVHRGCAQTHYDRDPGWRTPRHLAWCQAARAMYRCPNRWYVALARWTALEHMRHYGVPEATLIPHFAAPIERPPRVCSNRPVILGDFRNFNKGREAVRALGAALPEFEFRALDCTYETRAQAYASADAYLCLSLSEGGSWSLADAEAARLAIVTTNVGNCFEFTQAVVIDYRERDNPATVRDALRRALAAPRESSFFDSWTFDRWTAAWRNLVEEVAAVRWQPPVLRA
jgi:hypothetical protein